MDEYTRIKNKHKKKENHTQEFTPKFFFMMTKLLCTILLTLITLIVLKGNHKYKEIFHKYIFEKSFSFASINAFYEKSFGSPIPFKDLLAEKEKPVFDEKLTYKDISKYLEGAKLEVEENYLVPVKDTGMVVFVGDKEGYGKTIVIEGTDGREIWYGNMEKVNVKVYDYVEKGNFLGEVQNKCLYMVFKENGNTLDYTQYLP